MSLCKNCGVELEDGLKICPLCGKDQDNTDSHQNNSDNLPSGIIQIQKKERKKYFWELSAIIAFSGIVVCTIVDLVTSRELKWSLIADISLLAIWSIVTLFMFAAGRLWLILPGAMLSVLAALFTIDLVASGEPWFFQIALPLTLALFLSAGIVAALLGTEHFRGFNIIAASLIVLSGFFIVTEIIVDHYLVDVVDLRWSLIAAVSIFPLALIFLFFHYRIKKGKRLDSFFHI